MKYGVHWVYSFTQKQMYLYIDALTHLFVHYWALRHPWVGLQSAR